MLENAKRSLRHFLGFSNKHNIFGCVLIIYIHNSFLQTKNNHIIADNYILNNLRAECRPSCKATDAIFTPHEIQSDQQDMTKFRFHLYHFKNSSFFLLWICQQYFLLLFFLSYKFQLSKTKNQIKSKFVLLARNFSLVANTDKQSKTCAINLKY